MAAYLDPKPSDIEIIEAIRYHYPLNHQKADRYKVYATSNRTSRCRKLESLTTTQVEDGLLSST
jgi:hypothetical protein